MKFLFNIVYFLVFGCACVQSDQCFYEVCLCEDSVIKCQFRDLTSIPPLARILPGNWSLMLDNNAITNIPAGSLPPNLTSISLMNNPIKTIAADAFNGSSHTLTQLTLSYAHFTQIPDAFGRLLALNILTIYNTNIQDWNKDVMKKIGPSVATVDLETVGLTSWPTWIKYFTNLTDLTIIGNIIPSIPDDALDVQATTLTKLTLPMNKLKFLSKTISKLINLEHLELENNQISNITWIPQSTKLISLALSNNNIVEADHLSESLIPVEFSLKEVSIDHNKLTSIPNLSFLRAVTNFDLTGNRISDYTSGSLPSSLYSLDMRFNNLPAIPAVYLDLPVIKYMSLTSNLITGIVGYQIPTWIMQADLDSNLITALTDASFQEHSDLNMLNLNYNPLKTISNNAFKNLPNLNNLQLEGTLLTRMPKALSTLKNLATLNLSGIPNLVCTCMEKNVAPLIQMLENAVMGNCGVTSIFYFFHTLSPKCL